MKKLSNNVTELYALYAALPISDQKTFMNLVDELEACKGEAIRLSRVCRSTYGEWWQLMVNEAVWMRLPGKEVGDE